jgi:hypothetical protein
METKFKRGEQIAYIPRHAEGKISHPDVEFGFVTSGPNANGDYFCRYWLRETECDLLPKLRTKANSECTPVELLVPYKRVSAAVVAMALEMWC